MVIGTAILTPVTWARNAEWASDLQLSEAEYRKGMKEGRILQALVVHNLNAKHVSRAIEICDMHAKSFRRDWGLGYQCGFAYESARRYNDATQAFLRAANNRRAAGKIYLALALMDVRLNRKQEAKKYFEKSIDLAYEPVSEEYHTALMLIKLYPFDRSSLLQAKAHLEQALKLQPGYYPARQLLEKVEEVLEPTGRRTHQ